MGDLTVPLVIVGVFVVLGGVFAFLRLRPKAKPVEFYYFFCPGCKRKFRSCWNRISAKIFRRADRASQSAAS